MDLFTHALLPYLVGSILRLNKRDLTALVLGGIAPGIDVLLVWISYFYPNYLLITHRGFTHTFFFGFFIALTILHLASYEPVKDRIRRFVDFEPLVSGRTAILAYIGVLSHLFLDYLTTRDIPPLFPLDYARWSAEVFFYTEGVMTTVSLNHNHFVLQETCP